MTSIGSSSSSVGRSSSISSGPSTGSVGSSPPTADATTPASTASPASLGDRFETTTGSPVERKPGETAQVPEAANQPELDAQLQQQMQAATLGAGIGDTISDVAKTTASSAKKATKSRHDRLAKEYGDDHVTTQGAKKTMQATGHVSSVVGGTAALLDGDASAAQKVKGGAELTDEAAQGIGALAKRKGGETVEDIAGKTGKVAGTVAKGAGLTSNVQTLLDEDASATEKLRAGTSAVKTGTELTQSAAEAIAKRTAREGLEKGAKTVAKGAAKAVPVLGWAVDAAATADAAKKAYDTFNDPKATTGDKVWASVHTATTAAGFVPVVGDAISFVGDIANIWLGK